MVLLQKLPPALNTFGKVSDYLLKKILHGCSRVAFFVANFYLEDSAKNMERDRRLASGSLQIKMIIITRDQAVPKQFSKFLRNSKNKLELLQFLLKDWSTNESHCDQLDGKELYFATFDQAVCLSSNQGRLSCINVPERANRQEEADTKIFLSTAFASSLGFHAVNIITVDSDVAILSLYFQSQLAICIYNLGQNIWRLFQFLA